MLSILLGFSQHRYFHETDFGTEPNELVIK